MTMDSKKFGYPGPIRQTGSNTVDAEGDKYEYLCAFCSATVGTKMDRQAKPVSLIV